eukprot:1158761-Pelagomonas_calceolata.AAC.4
MAVLDVQFMKLSGWSCAASHLFVTPRIAEYPMRGGSRWSIGRSDQGSTRASLLPSGDGDSRLFKPIIGAAGLRKDRKDKKD